MLQELVNIQIHSVSSQNICENKNLRMARLGVFLCLLFVMMVAIQSASGNECTPNEVKKDKCNTCTCIEPGIWICTKIQCLEKRAVPALADTCTVEGATTSFDNGCNTCICTNGIWACTQKLCI